MSVWVVSGPLGAVEASSRTRMGVVATIQADWVGGWREQSKLE